MVDSIGMRRGLIIPGDRSDGLERQGSNPWSTTKQWGMGRGPRFALQADSLIGSSPIFSTKQLRVAIVAAESHKLVSKRERYPRPLPMPLLEYATTRGS